MMSPGIINNDNHTHHRGDKMHPRKRLWQTPLLIVACAALIMLFAACQQTNENGQQSAGTSQPVNEQPASETEQVADSQPVAADPASEAPEDHAATRTITDAEGEVEIPVAPQRIVDISGSTEELLVLGIRPVMTGNVDIADQAQPTPLVAAAIPDVEVAGWFNTEVSLELVLAAQPDLILAGPSQAAVYEELAKIAPTVRVSQGFNAFRERFAFIAEVFEKQDEMEQWLADYESRAIALHDDIVDAAGEGTYAIIEATAKEVRIYATTGVASIVFEDLGLTKDPGTPEPDPWGGKVTSLEGLATLDPDHIVLMADSTDNVLETSELWANMRANQEGHVYRFTTRQNYNEAFYAMGKEAVMEQLAEAMITQNGTQ